MAEESPKRELPRRVYVVPAVVALACAVLRPPSGGPKAVAFSEFLSRVQAGEVEEVTIRDRREYVFRSRDAEGGVVIQETIGPAANDALIATFRPADSRLPPPTIRFEK